MENLTAWIDAHPVAFIAAAWLWVGGGIALSVFFRLRRRKPIFAKPPADALFVERRTSGRSLRNFVTSVGGASNALMVAVTPDAVVVQPHFPFTLMFLPEVYGLDEVVTRSRLRKVEEVGGILGRKIVLEFSSTARGDERLELRLRDPDRFLEAVARMRRGSTA